MKAFGGGGRSIEKKKTERVKIYKKYATGQSQDGWVPSV